MWELCKIYSKLPTDPFITEMDPVLKLWLYYQWLGDHRDDAELAKNHAYLLGSFYNPEAVREMLNSNVHESSDEEMEESLKMVSENEVIEIPGLFDSSSPQKPNNSIKRRRHRATVKV